MSRKVVCFLSVTLLFFIAPAVFAGRDDDFVQEYPGGDYGLDLGEGYEVMPDGEFLPPAGYREDYKDTKYGPMTDKGFIDFPGFRFRSSEKPTVEKRKEEKDYIFHEATTVGGSTLWGVSGPLSGDDTGSSR